MKRTMLAITVVVILSMLVACAPTASATLPPSGNETQPPDSATQPPKSETQASNTPEGETVDISMKNLQFVPKEVTIKAGTTVIWTNNDDLDHTVDSGTRDDPTDLFASGNFGKGETFSYTFTTPGVYPYFCLPHQGMEGTITVTE